MDKYLEHHIDLLLERYPSLEQCKQSIIDAYDVLEECFVSGHKLLIAGNGGSCSDAEHIVGELMKGFKKPRECSLEFAKRLKEIDDKKGKELACKIQGCLPAIALNNHQALNTALINDITNGGEMIFAQQVLGYGQLGDVFLGISTSGNSSNVINAIIVAKAKGMKTIGLTGKTGGRIKEFCDVSIVVPLDETYMIQELHLPIYHCLCLMLEERFW